MPSINPNKPEATGLIHFYQSEDGKWNFVSEEDYQSQKSQLPDICFATRHPIKNFETKSFPNLKDLSKNLQQAESHDAVDSENGSSIQSDAPLYYSSTTINSENQRVFATEAQVLSEVWSVNPLIFYRVKRAFKGQLTEKLPVLEQADFFLARDCDESKAQTLFTWLKEDLSTEDFDSVKDGNKVFSELQKQVTDFTDEMLAEFLQVLERQSTSAEGNEIVDPNHISIEPSMFREGTPLSKLSSNVLNMRKIAQIKLIESWKKVETYC